MKTQNLTSVEFVICVMIALIIAAIPLGWIVRSYFESQTYNKLTGANTTTWDAMWVELRVQDSPRHD